jgi:uncharacterized protein YceK
VSNARYPYPGVHASVERLSHPGPVYIAEKGEEPWHTFEMLEWPFWYVFFLADLPLSATFDTILLPSDLGGYKESRQWQSAQPKKQPLPTEPGS